MDSYDNDLLLLFLDDDLFPTDDDDEYYSSVIIPIYKGDIYDEHSYQFHPDD